jgi:hypothetical protein
VQGRHRIITVPKDDALFRGQHATHGFADDRLIID